LKVGKDYGEHAFVHDMFKFVGKIVTIESVWKQGYRIEEDTCWWTDEMLEPVEEMSAEEALKTYTEFCGEHSCNDCPIQNLDTTYYCPDIRKEYPEDVVKVLKQWKADHEKKPIETEFIWYLLVVEEKTHIVKYEKPLKIERERTTDEQKEELLREWCSEHDGKYYVTTERRCVVRE
jgi:hypothetical protein